MEKKQEEYHHRPKVSCCTELAFEGANVIRNLLATFMILYSSVHLIMES